jgi:acetolactate synthase I/II/III large subunit
VKIKVADAVARALVGNGVRHVFMITGGGAMHLDDAVGREPGLAYVCNHHEQAAAIAAEGYFRASGRIAAVCVTTGPGGLNTLTGVHGQWTDSIPVVYLSGQVKHETTVESCPDLALRQLGDQEAPITRIVRPITKSAAYLRDPRAAVRELDQAIALALTPRFGPVWLDVPLDVQGAFVEEAELEAFDPRGLAAPPDGCGTAAAEVARLLAAARAPLFVAGHGIRLAGAIQRFRALAERLEIPVVTTFNGFDLMPSDHPCFAGRIGTIGDRAGNFALQAADLVVALGTRNNVRQTGYNFGDFARGAKRVAVDVDPAELSKPTARVDVPIVAELGRFLAALDDVAAPNPSIGAWRAFCADKRHRFDVLGDPGRWRGSGLDPYRVVDALTRLLPEGAVVVAGNGTASVALFQAARVKAGQRMICNSGCASMGYDLPAAIGAAFARPGESIACLAGDGSLMMNLQELATVAHHGLPIKLFVLDNDGYLSIKMTQDGLFGGHRVGCSRDTGVGLPDFARVADGFGLPFRTIERAEDLDAQIAGALAGPGPQVCVVKLAPEARFAPKSASEKLPDGRIVSKPLDDMWPFLSRGEYERERWRG